MKKYLGIATLTGLVIFGALGVTGYLGYGMLKDKFFKYLSSIGTAVDLDLGALKLKNIEGQEVSIQDLTHDKLSVVVFWASWHEASLDQLKILSGAKELDLDLTVIAINLGEEPNLVRSVAQSADHTFIYLNDESNSSARLLGISSLPRSLIIDSNGQLHSYNRTVQIDDIRQYL